MSRPDQTHMAVSRDAKIRIETLHKRTGVTRIDIMNALTRWAILNPELSIPLIKGETPESDAAAKVEERARRMNELARELVGTAMERGEQLQAGTENSKPEGKKLKLAAKEGAVPVVKQAGGKKLD